MREIKFRAWDTEDNKLFYPTRLSFMGDFSYAYHPDKDYELQLDNKFIMQYTGLKDKNGKEIYEGDIVNYDERSFAGGLNGLVEWVGSGFYIAKHIPIYEILKRFNDVQVIGNIYENSELLKG